MAGYGAGMSGDLAGTFLSFIFIPLSIGALAAINTWDLPTYLGLTALALLYASWRLHGRVRLLAAGSLRQPAGRCGISAPSGTRSSPPQRIGIVVWSFCLSVN